MAKNKKLLRQNITAWIFNMPYVLYTFIFLVIPLGWAFWLSITDWNLMTPDYHIVGIKNFADLFKDEKIGAAFWNSYRFLVPLVILCFLFGVVIALLVSGLPRKLKGIAAVVFFIPYLTSGVATSVVVKYLFGYNSALNIFLRDNWNLDIKWMQSKAAFWIIVGMIAWKMAGYYALFILSAIEAIPEEVYEAARLDSCCGFKKLIFIVLPMITPTLTSVVVLAAGLSFAIFSEPFLLTGGGPAMSTTTWQMEIYHASFVNFNTGYGAAMAIVNAIQIFITLQLVTFFMNRINRKFGWY